MFNIKIYVVINRLITDLIIATQVRCKNARQ